MSGIGQTFCVLIISNCYQEADIQQAHTLNDNVPVSGIDGQCI